MRHWWHLTEEEAERLNPPIQTLDVGADGQIYISVIDDPEWQPVGYVPSPSTRLGWFVFHLISGLAMRYPWWKVIGFSLANTNPGDDSDWDDGILELEEGWPDMPDLQGGVDRFAEYPVTGEVEP